MFVTHDRMFLRRWRRASSKSNAARSSTGPATTTHSCNAKQAFLDAEEKQNALFDKRLAQEEVWIRKGIKARRTRNEGRVRALIQMRRERADRRIRVGTGGTQDP